MSVERECRKLEKEVPHMLKKRTKKIINLLESLAKEGEKKIDTIIGEKVSPLLDLLEDWLSEAKISPTKKKKTTKKTVQKRKAAKQPTAKKKVIKKKARSSQTKKTTKQTRPRKKT